MPQKPDVDNQETAGDESHSHAAASTLEERYQTLIEILPVGFYMVTLHEGVSLIRSCNRQFAEIFGYKSEDETVGLNVEGLYSLPDEREKLLSAIASQDEAKKPLVGFPLRVKTRTGEEKVIEVSSQVVRDRHGMVTGRVGVVRDITSEAALRDFLDTVRADIGGLLHGFSSTLFSVRNSLQALCRSVGTDPFDGTSEPTQEQISGILEKPVRTLAGSLSDLLEALSAAEPAVLSEASRTQLVGLQELVVQLNEIHLVEFRVPAAREAAFEIIKVCGSIRVKGPVHNTLKRVRAQAGRIVRICNFITLHRTDRTIVDMDTQILLFREYVVSGVNPDRRRSLVRIGTLIQRTAQNLEEFARNRCVAVRYDISDPEAKVEVAERDVVRALSSLLNNAIKYSWARSVGQSPWVTVSTRSEGERVLIELVNWGVPIPKEEIERGLIFQVGYRGRLSGDMGRLGTGVGLADAMQVARVHQGGVFVESRPASPTGPDGDSPDYYKQPFLTKVAFWLPLDQDKVSDAT